MSEKTIYSILSAVHDGELTQEYAKKFDQCGITYASLMELMHVRDDKECVYNKLKQVKDLPPGVYRIIANAVSKE